MSNSNNNKTQKIKVIVHVEDGMVNDVYSDNPHIDLEIVDMDTQDWDVKGNNKQRLAEIRSATYNQLLFRF